VINYLKGVVTDRAENWLTVEVNGVGYKVFVPADTLFAARAGEGIELFCHHHFSQDSQSLYGFPEKRHLALFEMLLTISGVGPKSALSILSRAKPEEIEHAIFRGDATLFTAMSGVGKKKADLIILELRPKLTGRRPVGNEKETTDARKVVSALEGLGYRREEILETLQDMPSDLLSDSDRIKWALRHLYR
jgi:Holliday junction DNA helicase RuvA